MKNIKSLLLAALSVGLMGFSSAAKANVTFDFSNISFTNQTWAPDTAAGTGSIQGFLIGSGGSLTGSSGLSYVSGGNSYAITISPGTLVGGYNEATGILTSVTFRFSMSGTVGLPVNDLRSVTRREFSWVPNSDPDFAEFAGLGALTLTTVGIRDSTGLPRTDSQTQSGQVVGVPEIDGKMLPQVALLLGSLYLLFVFGRRGAGRRESVSPVLAQAA